MGFGHCSRRSNLSDQRNRVPLYERSEEAEQVTTASSWRCPRCRSSTRRGCSARSAMAAAPVVPVLRIVDGVRQAEIASCAVFVAIVLPDCSERPPDVEDASLDRGRRGQVTDTHVSSIIAPASRLIEARKPARRALCKRGDCRRNGVRTL